MPESQRPTLRTRDSRSASPPLRADALPASLRFVGSNTSQSNANNNGGRDEEENDTDEEMEEPRNQIPAHSPTSSPNHRSSPLEPTNQVPFRSAQPGVPSTNLPMAPADRAQWNQLADIFELDSKHRAEALRISSITGSENQYHASVCLLQKTRQDMDNVVSQLRSASSWKPAADLGTRLTKIIRETLQDHTMESYTYRVDSKKKPIQRSFEKIAMNAIINQSESWKLENLPQDFGSTLTDLKKHEAFMKFFGAKVRHVRDDFRIALLTNILVTHANIDEPAQPVPKLSELLLLLTRFFNPQDPRTAKEIEADMDSKAKARFAYLRIEAAIYNYTNQVDRKLRPGQSHWAWVDQQLENLRGQKRSYRRAFDTIVIATDQGFFDGNKSIFDIKEDEKFRVPTEDDVSQAMEFMSSNIN